MNPQHRGRPWSRTNSPSTEKTVQVCPCLRTSQHVVLCRSVNSTFALGLNWEWSVNPGEKGQMKIVRKKVSACKSKVWSHFQRARVRGSYASFFVSALPCSAVAVPYMYWGQWTYCAWYWKKQKMSECSYWVIKLILHLSLHFHVKLCRVSWICTWIYPEILNEVWCLF